jgi:phosphoribosylformimino-5-aminoimidazole carboxamide ribotide isomerase
VEVIPAIDVLGGRVVRLLRGDFGQATIYADDPVEVAQGFAGAGARLVHLVDLEGARSGVANPDLWKLMAGAGIRFQVGGGIRDVATADLALSAGAARVVMGSTAIWRPGQLASISDLERLVAAIDVRDGRAVGSGWLDEGRGMEEVLEAVVDAGVGRVLVTAISRDGALQGPDLELVTRVRRLAPELAVIASGGVDSIDHLRALAAAGCEAAVVGRALYEGRLNLEGRYFVTP